MLDHDVQPTDFDFLPFLSITPAPNLHAVRDGDVLNQYKAASPSYSEN
jgi:hypothetical protein